jgi:Cft2 family RNA processing exonuclease
MLDWDEGPRISGTDLYLDSRRPRALSLVSHAHSDHLSSHLKAIATPVTHAFAATRAKIVEPIHLPFNQEFALNSSHRLSLHPAGHTLGSAMARIQRDDGVSLLYTGDCKMRPGPTADLPDPQQADILVTESTYGRPMFRFPPFAVVAAKLVELVGQAFRDGRQPIVMGYALGKAQHAVKVLTDAGFAVTEHGAVNKLSDLYESHGVHLGARRKYAAADFRGKVELDLLERGVLVAPPQVARSYFSQQFERSMTIMLSGWALLKGAEYRYGVDHVLPISDHCDFDELLELIDRVRPKKVLSLHGFKEFPDTLRARGIDADLAKPDPQMKLFG